LQEVNLGFSLKVKTFGILEFLFLELFLKARATISCTSVHCYKLEADVVEEISGKVSLFSSKSLFLQLKFYLKFT